MTKLPTTLTCRYFPQCSGCEIHGEIGAPPVWREISDFLQRTVPQLIVPLVLGEVVGWRTRAKLAVRGTVEAPAIGLFKRGTHEVVAIADCPLHHPLIQQIFPLLLHWIQVNRIEPYQEALGKGILRYVQFSIERRTQRAELVLVLNSSVVEAPFREAVKQLYNEEKFHSIWVNLQPEKTNRIFGEQWIHCAGEPFLWERLGQAEVAFHPACFAQANLSLFDKVLKRICEWVAPNSRVLELYCGTGAIGLNLVHAGCIVEGIEINPFAVECFEKSRQRLPASLQSRISLHIAASESVAFGDCEVLIVDPPRKGLGAALVEKIQQASQVRQLIYLSCGPQSFQADVQVLLNQGWTLEYAEGYLFFPGTNHVEMLCSLKRKESG